MSKTSFARYSLAHVTLFSTCNGIFSASWTISSFSLSSATTQCKILFLYSLCLSSVFSPVSSVALQQVMSLNHWALTTHTHTRTYRHHACQLDVCLDTSFLSLLFFCFLLVHYLAHLSFLHLCSPRPTHLSRLLLLYLCSPRPTQFLLVSLASSSLFSLTVFSSTYTCISLRVLLSSLFFWPCSWLLFLTPAHSLVVFSSTYTSLSF